MREPESARPHRGSVRFFHDNPWPHVAKASRQIPSTWSEVLPHSAYSLAYRLSFIPLPAEFPVRQGLWFRIRHENYVSVLWFKALLKRYTYFRPVQTSAICFMTMMVIIFQADHLLWPLTNIPVIKSSTVKNSENFLDNPIFWVAGSKQLVFLEIVHKFSFSAVLFCGSLLLSRPVLFIKDCTSQRYHLCCEKRTRFSLSSSLLM